MEIYQAGQEPIEGQVDLHAGGEKLIPYEQVVAARREKAIAEAAELDNAQGSTEIIPPTKIEQVAIRGQVLVGDFRPAALKENNELAA